MSLQTGRGATPTFMLSMIMQLQEIQRQDIHRANFTDNLAVKKKDNTRLISIVSKLGLILGLIFGLNIGLNIGVEY